tara:strand:+ start:860 stop:1111 length:252 start_codon:yes stop_codon:yes gene_type:complete
MEKHMKKYTFTEAKDIFLAKAGSNYSKIPSEEFSSSRRGGWIIKDTEDMYIGFVGYRGGTEIYDYMPQTSETIKDNKFYKESK